MTDEEIIRRALQLASGADPETDRAVGSAQHALDVLVDDRDRAAETLARHRCPVPPSPVITETGPARRMTLAWPDGRPEWVAVAPEVLEAIAHELNAHRVAQHARSLPWWRRWRVRRG